MRVAVEEPVRTRAPSWVERRGPQSVLAAVAAAYVLSAWLGPRWLRHHPSLDVYVLRPVVWAAVAGLAIVVWRRAESYRPLDRFAIVVAAGAGVVHVAMLGIGGLVFGFGHSAGVVGPVHIPLHTWFLAATIAGAEAARPVLLAAWSRRNRDVAFVVVTLLFFVIATPPTQFSLLTDIDVAVRIVGGLWIPAIAIGAVATWMCVVGGTGPSFAYRMVLGAYGAFLPVLPSLGWRGQMIFGVAGAAVAGLFVVAVTRADTAEDSADHRHRRTVHPMVTVGAVVAALALAGGVFGVRTMTITGISMEPTYHRGDVVVVWERFDATELEPGDVILYELGRLPVAHRIVAMGDGEVVTQGDNVRRADPPIDVETVEGKVIGRIPLVGYPILWLGGR